VQGLLLLPGVLLLPTPQQPAAMAAAMMTQTMMKQTAALLSGHGASWLCQQ
jgi:hypothetical protein